jgi:lipid-binding SYLF domain-containing protein
MINRRLVLGTLSATVIAGGLAACTTTEEQRLTREEAARASLNDLYRTVPAARTLGEESAAVLVFPSIVRAGLMIGGQFGDGVMFENDVATGFYRVTGGSFGLQAGAQNFAQAYFFTTPEALQTFRDTAGWEVGAGVNVAVASVGATGQINTSTLQAPVVVFVYGQAGLMAGIQVEGQRISRLREG